MESELALEERRVNLVTSAEPIVANNEEYNKNLELVKNLCIMNKRIRERVNMIMEEQNKRSKEQ